MRTRMQLDHELDELALMLPIWLEKLRHPSQFWPQFDALAHDISCSAGPEDAEHVRRRLELLLQCHGLRHPHA
jgi:hypothetical protein